MKNSAVVIRSVMLLGLLLPPTAWPWGPYDDDPYGTAPRGNNRAEAVGQQRPLPGYYGSPGVPSERGDADRTEGPRWPGDGDRGGRDWGASRWYTDEAELYRGTFGPAQGQRWHDSGPAMPPDASVRHREPNPPNRLPRAGPAAGMHDRRRPDPRPDRPADGAHDGGGDWTAPGSWEQPVAGTRYHYRPDPRLDALSGPGPTGYRYRPLTARELKRRDRDIRQPEYRAEDLQPQGPRRSYQDAGSAFGYHHDDRFDRRHGRDRP
jgi:hypothetical protein